MSIPALTDRVTGLRSETQSCSSGLVVSRIVWDDDSPCFGGQSMSSASVGIEKSGNGPRRGGSMYGSKCGGDGKAFRGGVGARAAGRCCRGGGEVDLAESGVRSPPSSTAVPVLLNLRPPEKSVRKIGGGLPSASSLAS